MKKIINIYATSDWHGLIPYLYKLDTANNLLLIGGDICPVSNHEILNQKKWLNEYFIPAMEDALNIFDAIVFIAGNHDFIFEQKTIKEIFNKPLPDRIFYLQNNSVNALGLNVWGSPMSNQFYDWAFMDTDDRLDQIYQNIPSDTDIVLSHGPAHGVCDQIKHRSESLGSQSLYNNIERVCPKLLITGHIHSAVEMGEMYIHSTECKCVSYLNESYQPKYSLYHTTLERNN